MLPMLMFQGAMPFALRILACAALLLSWRSGNRFLRLEGRGAVRRLYWGRDGQWQLFDGTLNRHYVRLSSPARSLGSLLWIRFRSDRKQFLVLLEASVTEPGAFRALKGRLVLEAWRREPTLDSDH